MSEGRAAPLLLYGESPESILTVANLLREGGVCVVPTDTVYGLAASIFRPDAVQRVFTIKRRAPQSAVPVLLATASDLPILAASVPRAAWALIDRFWPGPLTLVFPARRSVSATITGAGSTVAVRVPAGKAILRLLEVLGEPVVGTSANRHGERPSLTPAEALASVGVESDAILGEKNSPLTGIVSTVAEVREDEVVIHRVGAIEAESIRHAIGARVFVRR